SDVQRLSIPPCQGLEDLNCPLTRGAAPGFYIAPVRGFSNRLSVLSPYHSALFMNPRGLFRRQIQVARAFGIPVRIDYRWFVVFALSAWVIAASFRAGTT